MATPKFDRIAVEFSQRIYDPITVTSGVMSAGAVLTIPDICTYVNKALLGFFNDMWIAKKDIASFTQMFPELIRTATITLTAGSQYTLATPNLDYFTILSGQYSTKYISAPPVYLYHVYSTGKNLNYAADSNNPIIFEMNKIFSVQPTSIKSTTIEILFIKQPLDPTTGAFYTQNGSYDSPFYDHWNSKIAEYAEKLYKTDTGAI